MSKKQHDDPSVETAAEDAAETAATPDPAAEAEKFRDLAMRTAADFDNYRKRAAREKEAAIRSAFLTSSGLEEIKTEGAEFDPNMMEAVGHEPDDKVSENRVLRQTRRGYKLRDRLLRPASVIVSKGPAK
jgi:molecular chaperone GrpE